MIKRGHVRMQRHHKNVEACANKVWGGGGGGGGLSICWWYCPISLIVGRFLCILLKDVV